MATFIVSKTFFGRYRHGEGLRRWRQPWKVEIALRSEVRVSIVVDVPAPQVLEEPVEVAKLIQHGQLMDPL